MESVPGAIATGSDTIINYGTYPVAIALGTDDLVLKIIKKLAG